MRFKLEFSSFTYLDWLDLLLMVAGGIILAYGGLKYLFRSRGRDPLRGSPLRANELSAAWVWLALLVYFASALIGNGLASLFIPAQSSPNAKLWRDILIGNIHQLMLIAAVLGIASFTFAAGLKGFGIGRQTFGRDILIAVQLLLVSLCVCNLIGWSTNAVFRFINPQFIIPEHPFFTTVSLPTTPAFIRINAILGAVLLAPIGEELFFRGILQTSLRKVFPARQHSLYHRWAAIVSVAILFGLMHLGTPQHVPALIVLGVILGYVYERSGSLTASIYLHILFNSKSVLWFYLGRG